MKRFVVATHVTSMIKLVRWQARAKSVKSAQSSFGEIAVWMMGFFPAYLFDEYFNRQQQIKKLRKIFKVDETDQIEDLEEREE